MDLSNRVRQYFHTEDKPTPVPATMPETALEERQALLAHFVRLVANGSSFGLFVAGAGGSGKSRTIQNTLAAEGIFPTLVNSHITPLGLYQTLFYNRTGKIIWLDDCDSIYSNLQILGLLRSALWGQGERQVTYTSSQLKNVPGAFVFNSRIIFCANTIPQRNEAFRAVLSRVDVFQLDASNEEVLEQMRWLARRGYDSLSPASCLEVIDFIERYAGSRQLSMRLYESSLKKYLYAVDAGIDWKDLIRCQLNQLGGQQGASAPKQSDAVVMAQALDAFPDSAKAQENFWCEATGKSRATFFRSRRSYLEAEKK